MDKISLRYVDAAKWKNFATEITNYLCDKTKCVFVTEPRILIHKHFSDRVRDRRDNSGSDIIIKTMFYHVINYNLCELLFWYKNKDLKSLDIIIQNYRVTLDKNSYGDIIARTFWQGDSSENILPSHMQIILNKVVKQEK